MKAEPQNCKRNRTHGAKKWHLDGGLDRKTFEREKYRSINSPPQDNQQNKTFCSGSSFFVVEQQAKW
jgi:hypothetical protein